MSWGDALAHALVGEPVALPALARGDLDGLLAALAAQGHDRAAIAAHEAACREAGERWPHPVPRAMMSEVGFAAHHALEAEALRRLGLDQPERQVVADRPLDAAERRLSQDLPPHHGHVG